MTVVPFPSLRPVPPEEPGAGTINLLIEAGREQAAELIAMTAEVERLRAGAAALADHAEEQRLFINEVAETISKIGTWSSIFWLGFVLGFGVAAFIGIVMVFG